MYTALVYMSLGLHHAGEAAHSLRIGASGVDAHELWIEEDGRGHGAQAQEQW